MKKLLLDFV